MRQQFLKEFKNYIKVTSTEEVRTLCIALTPLEDDFEYGRSQQFLVVYTSLSPLDYELNESIPKEQKAKMFNMFWRKWKQEEDFAGCYTMFAFVNYQPDRNEYVHKENWDYRDKEKNSLGKKLPYLHWGKMGVESINIETIHPSSWLHTELAALKNDKEAEECIHQWIELQSKQEKEREANRPLLDLSDEEKIEMTKHEQWGELTDSVHCIHCRKDFQVKDIKYVLHNDSDGWREMVCPHYPKCDGNALDIVSGQYEQSFQENRQQENN